MFPPTFASRLSVNSQPIKPEFGPILTPGHARYYHIFMLLALVPPPGLRGNTSLLYPEDSISIVVKGNIFFETFSYSSARFPPLSFYIKVSHSTFHMIWKLPFYICLPQQSGSTCRKGLISAHLFLYLKVEYRI